MYNLPQYPGTIRKKAEKALVLCADWIIANQKVDEWPCWSADRGRFLSIASTNKTRADTNTHYTICWNTARTAQALLSAYKICEDRKYLEAATCGMEYVKTCQIFDPESPEHRGACREETPLGDHIAARDTIEAVQGFLNMYEVSDNDVWKTRAEEALKWITGTYIENNYYPAGYIWHRKDNETSVSNDFTRMVMAAAAIPFIQYERLTGDDTYIKFIPGFMNSAVEDFIKDDGAIRVNDGTDVGHHADKSGDSAGCFTNDDGFGIAMIASYLKTGNEKYKIAAVKNGEWWLKRNSLPETYASIPSALIFLLDMYRFTGDKRYSVKSEEYIDAVIDLQYAEDTNPLFYGGFRGHDCTDEREINLLGTRNALDAICLRTSMYAVMGLAKVAAVNENQWNMTYSAFTSFGVRTTQTPRVL